MATPDELIAALEREGETYASLIAGQSPEAFRRKSGPEEWSAAEQTGHVAEFPVTFAEQARRLASDPNVALGRTLDDAGRLGAVRRLADADPQQAAEAVRAGVRQAAEILRRIPADRWSAKGRHGRDGELTVQDVVERFIVAHLRGHVEQVRATLGAGEGG